MIVAFEHYGLNCVFASILSYFVLQLGHILITACRDSQFLGSWTEWWGHPERQWYKYFFTGFVVLLVISCLTSSIATILQITGVFRNCWCFSESRNVVRVVSLARDTQTRRDNSRKWAPIAYAAIGLTGVVCYLGWQFVKQIDELAVMHPVQVFSNTCLDNRRRLRASRPELVLPLVELEPQPEVGSAPAGNGTLRRRSPGARVET